MRGFKPKHDQTAPDTAFNPMISRRVIVVGGGASGLMAAGRAAESGADTLLLEKMRRPGRKLAITGKGRCNLTNIAELSEFIGQKDLVENLNVSIQAAKKRNEPIEHMLFSGPPGLGKTTLAHIISYEMGSNIKVTSGPALERVGDLAAILTNLEEGDILFIDEIHRLNRSIEEVLYPAMEDFALDIIIGKGPSARTLRLDLHKFTLIGATTKLSLIGAPLRDRFGAIHHMNFYTLSEMSQIIKEALNF
jgi:Holliday junction resolvasome RuvABC ATP-dependent DNA helicase subunit